jgi:hypothetical protein
MNRRLIGKKSSNVLSNVGHGTAHGCGENGICNMGQTRVNRKGSEPKEEKELSLSAT